MDHRLVTTNLFLPCWTLRKTALTCRSAVGAPILEATRRRRSELCSSRARDLPVTVVAGTC